MFIFELVEKNRLGQVHLFASSVMSYKNDIDKLARLEQSGENTNHFDTSKKHYHQSPPRYRELMPSKS
jgi:hypothetical protein